MGISRRRALGAGGTAITAVLAGCSGWRTRQTATPEATLQARLRGPETDRVLFTGIDIATVGRIRNDNRVPVTLTDTATETVTRVFRSAGVPGNADAFDVVIRTEGQTITRFGITAAVARNVAEIDNEGPWGGRFMLHVSDREDATELRKRLVAITGAVGSPTETPVGTTARPPADHALVVTSHLAVEGTMVNVGVEGTATNTASVALVDCVIDVEGTVGGERFSGRARRSRLTPDETWEWAVAFGKEADALDDNSVENIAITTQAAYDA